MGRISYPEYLASPQYRKFPFKELIGWLLYKSIPSVEDLQKEYNFSYYSTMSKAVTDVNNGTVANADASKDTAVAGVYTDENGGKNVVLLKDATEAAVVQATVDMTINLGGHVLSTQGKVGIAAMGGNVKIDGRLTGSKILNIQSGNIRASAIATTGTGTLLVDGGTYECYGDILPTGHGAIISATPITVRNANVVIETISGVARGIAVSNSATIINTNIMASSKGGESAGIWAYAGSVVEVSHCNIKIFDTGDVSNSSAVYNLGTTSIRNCDIRAYSNYGADGDSYTAFSVGVSNHGTLQIENCYVFGMHSGISTSVAVIVNGGTYEGYGHGGFYFSGADTTSYVRNAIIRDCDMPDGYVDNGGGRNGAGFYIGGGNNIKVYMDNCEIYGAYSQIVLRGAGEDNNTLYISRSKLHDTNGDKLSVRIDVDSHKLYIGKDCNFTAENTTRPSSVIQTDEVYVEVA